MSNVIIGDKEYRAVPVVKGTGHRCSKCVALMDDDLCDSLPECASTSSRASSITVDHVYFVEEF
jgi:hypothetical protein